ncbi:MAG: hypothetical protein KBT31_00850 [Firmicutes bacterium]|nr:hypothetical protein [Candidatus Colimorpha enterica]
MKSELFQDAICDIDDDLIRAADAAMPKKSLPVFKTVCAVAAACVALVCAAVIAVPMFRHGRPITPPIDVTTETKKNPDEQTTAGEETTADVETTAGDETTADEQTTAGEEIESNYKTYVFDVEDNKAGVEVAQYDLRAVGIVLSAPGDLPSDVLPDKEAEVETSIEKMLHNIYGTLYSYEYEIKDEKLAHTSDGAPVLMSYIELTLTRRWEQDTFKTQIVLATLLDSDETSAGEDTTDPDETSAGEDTTDPASTTEDPPVTDEFSFGPPTERDLSFIGYWHCVSEPFPVAYWFGKNGELRMYQLTNYEDNTYDMVWEGVYHFEDEMMCIYFPEDEAFGSVPYRMEGNTLVVTDDGDFYYERSDDLPTKTEWTLDKISDFNHTWACCDYDGQYTIHFGLGRVEIYLWDNCFSDLNDHIVIRYELDWDTNIAYFEDVITGSGKRLRAWVDGEKLYIQNADDENAPITELVRYHESPRPYYKKDFQLMSSKENDIIGTWYMRAQEGGEPYGRRIAGTLLFRKDGTYMFMFDFGDGLFGTQTTGEYEFDKETGTLKTRLTSEAQWTQLSVLEGTFKVTLDGFRMEIPVHDETIGKSRIWYFDK